MAYSHSFGPAILNARIQSGIVKTAFPKIPVYTLNVNASSGMKANDTRRFVSTQQCNCIQAGVQTVSLVFIYPIDAFSSFVP